MGDRAAQARPRAVVLIYEDRWIAIRSLTSRLVFVFLSPDNDKRGLTQCPVSVVINCMHFHGNLRTISDETETPLVGLRFVDHARDRWRSTFYLGVLASR